MNEPVDQEKSARTEITAGDMGHKIRSLILVGIGSLLLLVGVAAAFFGPAEMYCFYLFSEGGRFYYEGFGFGSFMFGNIAIQIAGYYVIAVVCVLLGYGHLKLRRWARTLSLALLWFWLILGIPLLIVFLFILFSAKALSPAAASLAVVLAGLSYTLVPVLLIRFYRSQGVKLVLESKDPRSHWVEDLPIPILVLCSLFLFYVVALHVPILFRGIFPLFGVFLFDLPGILLLDVSILCLVLLTWGVLRLRRWAWWGSLVYFGLLTSSVVLTLARASFLDVLSKMHFPPTEMDALRGLPFQGWHFAVFIGAPLLATLGLIVFSRRYFERRCDSEGVGVST